jgi:outer membrane protein assembly factor BamB
VAAPPPEAPTPPAAPLAAPPPAEPLAPAPPEEEGAPLDADALEMLRELGLGDGAIPATEPGAAPAALAEEPAEYTLATGGLPPIRTADAPTVDLYPMLPPPVRVPEAVAPHERPRRKRLRSLVVMAVLLALVGGATWAVVQAVGRPAVGNEAERAQKAFKDYDERAFPEAAQEFRELAVDFPQSPSAEKYRLLAEFSDVRGSIQEVQDPETLERNLGRLDQFVTLYREDPLLEKYHPALHEGFKRLGDEFKELARLKLDERRLKIARQAHKRAYDYTQARAVPAAVTKELDQIEQAIAASNLRKDVLAQLDRAAKKASAATVQQARARVTQTGLDKDAEVTARLARLPEAHRASIRFVPVQDDPEPGPPAEDRAPGVLLTPPLETHRGPIRPGLRPVLALARGVLYALEPDNGQVRWAVRVSPEATALPLWLPPSPLAPAQVLVLSSDSLTLSALDARTGATRWSHALAAPCLGRPVLVGDRALLPTYSGRVEEIEVNDGALRGFYELGQPLSAGGVRQPGTDLVYFPADSFCVYALDVGKRTCAAVLYTGHPSGSLLSPPVALSGGRTDGKQAAGYLLLAQADGLDAMKLRIFAVPAADADAEPVQEVRLQGWGSFPPKADGDSLALVTDAGEFVVYGVEPRADGSAPLFPRFRTQIPAGASGTGGHPRSLLAHAEGGRFWVLAHGGLHRLQAAFTRAQGPHLLAPGAALLRVGAPLHAAQARDNNGGLTLFLVTQSDDGAVCLATAVDERGTKRWQRQLGLVTRGQPVAVGPQILAQDISGRLFLFDPAKAPAPADRAWYFAGRLVRGRGADGGSAFRLLPAGDKVYAVAARQGASGPALRVLEFPQGEGSDALDFPLPSALAGTPAVVGGGLILPLADGTLVRQPLAGGKAETGPNWRDPQADPGAVGYVVALSGDEFLVTDGSRGLKRLYFDGKAFERRAAGEVPARIITPPAVLPPRDGESVARVCVADSAQTVTLLEGEGLTAPRRPWHLGGKITAGPFARGGGIVCVVEGRKLVWLDPAKDEPLWWADFRGDVVGAPQLIDGVLVVADQRGQIHALNPATGKAAGPGYSVLASAAPTAAPLPFGADRLLVPLTDGTVLLPSRHCLRHPLRGFPLFR